jgi:lysyl-tRNA synthetase class II
MSETKKLNSENLEKDQEDKNLPQNISFSSIETQKTLRIEKLKLLKQKGHNPFTPYSFRSFSLGFVKFWFDFIHKFDLTKVDLEENPYTLYYFLEQVLFPQSLIEQFEEKIQLRHTVRQMGLDPDAEEGKIDDEFDQEIILEVRKNIPLMIKTKEDLRLKFLREFINLHDLEDYSNSVEEEDLSLEDFTTLKPNQKVVLAGRIKSKRVSGKIAFATIEDEDCSDGFQFIFKKDDLDLNAKKPQIKEEKIDEIINIFS